MIMRKESDNYDMCSRLKEERHRTFWTLDLGDRAANISLHTLLSAVGKIYMESENSFGCNKNKICA